MTLPAHKFYRHSIRLQDYDYSLAGGYFITIVIKNRECLLGTIENGNVQINIPGKFVKNTWLHLPDHYPNIYLDEFCIMPNHIHGIIFLEKDGGYSLSEVIRGFKSYSARHINNARQAKGNPVWQRNYYEHIIRNEAELRNIRLYIQDNPRRWAEDEENIIVLP